MIKELSKRENEVVAEIAKGYSVKEIAQRMFLSPYTVDTHIKNSKKKTGARSLAGLTREFILSLDNPKTYFRNALAILLASSQITIASFSADIKMRRPRRLKSKHHITLKIESF